MSEENSQRQLGMVFCVELFNALISRKHAIENVDLNVWLFDVFHFHFFHFCNIIILSSHKNTSTHFIHRKNLIWPFLVSSKWAIYRFAAIVHQLGILCAAIKLKCVYTSVTERQNSNLCQWSGMAGHGAVWTMCTFNRGNSSAHEYT